MYTKSPWMRLRGGRDVKMDVVCTCASESVRVDIFDDADPISQLLH